MSKVDSSSDRNNVLENIGLLKSGRFNNAGVLFFTNDVFKCFKSATMQVVLYKSTNEVDILDTKEFRENLYSNYKNTIDYVISKLNTEYKKPAVIKLSKDYDHSPLVFE